MRGKCYREAIEISYPSEQVTSLTGNRPNVRISSNPKRSYALQNDQVPSTQDSKVTCNYDRCLISFKVRLKGSGKMLLVVLYIWLFLNAGPTHSLRSLRALMSPGLSTSNLFAQTLAGRSLAGKSKTDNGNGLSTVEAIALIQAINSGNRGNSLDQGTQAIETRQHILSQPSNRQFPIPVPVPAPLPNPLGAALAAAIAAFAAAVARGLAPAAAFAAAVAAAAATFLAAIAALFAVVLIRPKTTSPFIKKLVIKKTVLPFVVPVPIIKKEKEVIVKYKAKEQGHKKLHERYEKIGDRSHKAQLDKIERLLTEQDKLQSLVDRVVEIKGATRAALTS